MTSGGGPRGSRGADLPILPSYLPGADTNSPPSPARTAPRPCKASRTFWTRLAPLFVQAKLKIPPTRGGLLPQRLVESEGLEYCEIAPASPLNRFDVTRPSSLAMKNWPSETLTKDPAITLLIHTADIEELPGAAVSGLRQQELLEAARG